ncbi:MAG: sugar ABC transporter permease [Candidatus Dormibacteria bacterium]
MTALPLASDQVAPPLSGEVATSRHGPGGGGRFGRGLITGLFMAPAGVLLGAIVGYPLVATIVRSLYDRAGGSFVGLDNYRTMFGTADILVAIRNNAIWVIVFPFIVTFLGLVFAVLTERIRWSTAFKTIVFMPMAISLFASGVIWRIVYDTDPHRGVINSAVATVVDTVHQPGLYPTAKPISGLQPPQADGTIVSTSAVEPGGTVLLGLSHLVPAAVPRTATQAHEPQRSPGAISGVVWRDFSPGGKIGQIDPSEVGLPGVHLDLLDGRGGVVARTDSDTAGGFRFSQVASGTYHVAIDATNFRTPFQGVNWLGPQSLTPTSNLGSTARSLLSVPLVTLASIMAMLWVWAGFAMVVIGAGLAALNREVLEAARMDGASEWQTFRFVTFPLLRPVLIVVFITMIINVLKIFDIILAIAPDSSQQQANVIALEMWRVGFASGNFGLSSALAVFLFILVIPVMAINVRRIRG